MWVEHKSKFKSFGTPRINSLNVQGLDCALCGLLISVAYPQGQRVVFMHPQQVSWHRHLPLPTSFPSPF